MISLTFWKDYLGDCIDNRLEQDRQVDQLGIVQLGEDSGLDQSDMCGISAEQLDSRCI